MGIVFFFDARGLIARVSARKVFWVFFFAFFCVFVLLGGCFCAFFWFVTREKNVFSAGG